MAKLSLNNVTLAQEINGVAHIDSATGFPAGHIVQTVFNSDSTSRLYSGLSATTWYSNYTYLNTTITPKYSNSLLYVNCNVMFYGNTDTNGDGGAVFLRMMMNGTLCPELNGTDGNTFTNGQPNACFGHARAYGGTVTPALYDTRVGIAHGFVPAVDTTAKTFSIEYFIQVGSSRIRFNADPSTSTDTNLGTHSPNGRSTFTIMEIAQ